MPSIVIELTNHCNLSCQHCFDGRHSADGFLKVGTIAKILQNAPEYGCNSVSFTGGEPTLHPEFTEILDMVCKAGYKYGFVTNGWNFTETFEDLLPFRNGLNAITFSLDGAREETHDSLRGKGSYRRVMRAISICVVKDIPFTFNTVITSHNRNELKEMPELATKLGSRGLRFGHLIHTPLTIEQNLDISPDEQSETEAIILQLQKSFNIPIVMAPGHYTTNLFPCAPLQMQEINIDWQGNVTMCCHLSGHGNGTGNRDVIGNLDEMSFPEAYGLFVNLNKEFRKEKIERHSNSKREFKDSDYFPCWYCVNYFKKVDWLKEYDKNPWSRDIWTNNNYIINEQRRQTIHAGS